MNHLSRGGEILLLRFAVENHRSIRERQELSFAASALKGRADGLLSCDAVKSHAVVPAAVIYGANASGKTNLVDAVGTMRNLVLWSHIKGTPRGGVSRHKFRLDPDCVERPSCFEVDFTLEGVRYHYGFEATDRAFTSEWLYESPRAHSRKLFERQEQNFQFGRGLKGQNQSVARLTRSNSLFLSAAAQNGHELLTRVYEYFQNLVFTRTDSEPPSGMPTQFEGRTLVFEDVEKELDSRVFGFLDLLDTGVCGYRRLVTVGSQRLRQVPQDQAFQDIIEQDHMHLSVPEGFITDDMRTSVELAFSHRGKDGEKVDFEFDDESSGTRRLLAILGKIFRAIDEGLPIFIDELDLSLHTAASEAVLRLFCSRKTNPNGAQLLATTHDTNLMRSDILRRDQLWFAEKSKDGSTTIYPLTDFRTRKEDNIELGYRQGRYGAVPGDDPVASLLENC